MKILITGGTGYIGSHTTVALHQRGYEVVIVDDLSNSSADVLDRIGEITGIRPTFYHFDICDKKSLDALFEKEKKIRGVIHFAAHKAVGESVEEPLKYYGNNLTGMISLLDSMRRNNIPNIIFSSSATVYGQPEILPATENSPIQPASSPYGNTKQISEEILADSIRAYQGLQGIALRYFNPIGAHPSGLIGELPLGKPNNLMPFITQTAIGKHGELLVFGGDYETPDGTAIRDYIHVVDLAEAHVIALDRLLQSANEKPYETFNLGTGRGFSVLEVIRSFEKVSGISLKYRIVDRRPGDVENIYAGTSLANKVLGWMARLSLDDMTASAWKWERFISDRGSGEGGNS